MTTMLQVFAVLLLVACVPIAVAVVVLGVQVIAASVARPASKSRVPGLADSAAEQIPRPRLAVLTPAHDEADGIGAMLEALAPQMRAGDRMLVVADNCTDDTASIARALGATVVKRASATLRGKSFALAFGVDAMRADPPEVVVVVDADCRLRPGSLDALAHGVTRHGRPQQALDLMLAPPDAGLAQRLAEFAWRVRNWVRPEGAHHLGLPCQLMGTGMAFTWDMIVDAPLANGSLAEDMKLGIDFALRGQPPMFCDLALVISAFPDSAAATRSQRTRWEHGHLETIFREMPPIVWSALRRRDARLLGMALDLCVPPLALLATLLLGLDVASIVLWTIGSPAWLPGVPLALTLAFIATATLAWTLRGRDLVRFRELMSIPLYILTKLPIYARFLFRRQKQWVRTERK